MSLRRRCCSCRLPGLGRPAPARASLRNASSSARSAVEDMFSRPTWSVRGLVRDDSDATATSTEPATTPAQLHHLLRLAALPLPTSKQQEDAMLATLDAQLRFVRAVQGVDTRGVEPLSAIRDETARAVAERTIGLADMRHLLDKEALVGHYKRPRRVKNSVQADADGAWDALSTASKKAGRYFVVESRSKDSDPS